MVQASVVEEQLRRIGANFRFWNRPEINELHKILFEGEQINHVVNGRYEGGFAILVSTNLRVILVDKKPFFLTLEDIRYERIADVELNHRLLDATLRLGALTKDLKFTGYNPSKMRDLTSYIQERVMESRQVRNGGMQQAYQSAEAMTQMQQSWAPEMAQSAPAQAWTSPATNQYEETTANVNAAPLASVTTNVSDAQSEAIGQVAVYAAEEATSPYEQLMNLMSAPIAATDEGLAAQPPTNPYRSPLTFRRRVSRFY